MSRTHNILEIPMGDYEEPIVLNNGEDAKAFITSILNKVTFSVRWRGRGKRKVHAIADGYHARAYDQELPLDKSERQVMYVTEKPTKVDKRLQAIKQLDWRIKALKASIEEVAEGRIELNYKAERMKEYQRSHMEELQLAIRERTELTDAVEGV
jgi:hypothetical protein